MGVTMVTMLLMARLMTPEQFGTGALVLGSVAFISLYVGGFFHDALIQRPDIFDDVFETSMTISVLAGLVVVALATTAVIFMPAANSWHGMGGLVVAAGVALPFGGSLGVVSARMRRDLLFREIAQGSLIGRLVGCTVGLVMAYCGFGALSLVAQSVSDVALQSMMLMARSRWRPAPSFNMAKLMPLWRFALPNAAVHSISSGRLQVFLWMISGFISLAATGFVNVAFRITYTPQIVLATNFTNLALPILARHQASPIEMEVAFRLVTRLVLSATIPAFIGLALVAEDAVPILLGGKWNSITPLVRMMAVGVAVTFLRFPASLVLRALGNVRFSLFSALFQTTFVLVGMVLFQPRDLRAVVGLWMLPSFIQLSVTLIVARRVSEISWRIIGASFFPVLASTLIMAVAVLALSQAIETEPLLFRLFSKIVVGSAAYGLILIVMDRWIRDHVFDVLKRMRCAWGGAS